MFLQQNQLDPLISQIYFWNKTLHVLDSSSIHHQEFFTIHTAMVYVVQVCRQACNSTCFGQFLHPSSAVFHCTHSNGICHTACEQDQDRTPSWSCSQAVSKLVWHTPLLCVQWKTADDGQINCLKPVEFYCKHKFEKLVHLVGFIIRIYLAAWPPKCQTSFKRLEVRLTQSSFQLLSGGHTEETGFKQF